MVTPSGGYTFWWLHLCRARATTARGTSPRADDMATFATQVTELAERMGLPSGLSIPAALAKMEGDDLIKMEGVPKGKNFEF